MRSLSLLTRNRWLHLALGLVVVQQILVAVGTYMMGDLAGTFSTREPSLALLVTLFFCVSLPGTLLHYAVNWATVRTNKETLRAYFQAYATANFGNPSHWRDRETKALKHDVLTKTGQDSLLSMNGFFIDMAATTLNVILNTASVILITSSGLGIAIFAGGALGILLIHLGDKKIAAASAEEMRTESALNAHLGTSWDNIVLGNKVFFARWMDRLNELFRSSALASYENVLARDGATSVAGFLTNAIVVGTALSLAWVHRDSKAFAVAIIVMLPRSLQTTFHLQIIQSYWAQWKMHRQRLLQVDQSLADVPAADLARFIQRDALKLVSSRDSSNEIVDFESLISQSSGRYLISGENGAGKSTLLLELKMKLGEKAVYLPSHHQLVGSTLGLSSGQAAMTFLQDLESGKDEILLLDEWDANLSAGNRLAFHQRLEEISSKKLIVEVRHSHA